MHEPFADSIFLTSCVKVKRFYLMLREGARRVLPPGCRRATPLILVLKNLGYEKEFLCLSSWARYP